MLSMSYRAAMREPLLDVDQERWAIRQWQDAGDRGALELLLRSHARQAWSQAARYTDNPVHLEDLAAEGIIGLMRAADNFDRAQNVRFSTYAGWWVMNGISSSLARIKAVIDIPTRTFLDAQLGKLPEAERLLVRMAVAGTVPIDGAPGDERPEGHDILVSDDIGPEDAVLEQSQLNALSRMLDAAMSAMCHEEVEMIRRRKLKPVPDDLDRIALDLGITEARARQVEKRAILHLRRNLIDGGFSRSVLA